MRHRFVAVCLIVGGVLLATALAILVWWSKLWLIYGGDPVIIAALITAIAVVMAPIIAGLFTWFQTPQIRKLEQEKQARDLATQQELIRLGNELKEARKREVIARREQERVSILWGESDEKEDPC